jgi:DNA-binding CsgD family transcriptional regulator
MVSVQAIEAPLVERERELEALEQVLGAARRGEGTAAIVEGPAGIGKSCLLAATAAAAKDLRVQRARASELERDFPFGVVRQLFEPVLFSAVEDERDRLLAGAAALSQPVLVGAAVDDRDTPDAYAALHGLYWFAANLAEAQPVLIVVDDAHWADAASLRWLVFLLRRLEGMRLAVVLALRSGEAGVEEPPLDELVSDPDVRVIRPAVLSDEAIMGLVEIALGEAPEREFVKSCQQATAGNPFLVRELLAELAAQGVGATAANAAVVARVSASGVARAVSARLRRLPRGCLALARAASVLGDGCELTMAARIADLDGSDAARAADALAAASIVERTRPLTFVHPLVRASVYAELGAGERSALHARAADALGKTRADADRIAVHLLASEPGGDPEAVAILGEAAASARRRGAHDAAATYLRRALREPPSPQLEPQLLHELGSAELQTGEVPAATEHLRRALVGMSEAPRRALVALDLASGLLFYPDRGPEAVDVVSEALAELSEHEPDLAARLKAIRALAGWSSLDAYRRLSPVHDMPVPAGSTSLTTGERLDLSRQAVDEMLTGTAERARSLALQALGDGELLEATGTHYSPFCLPLGALIWAHAFDDAERHLQAALADARRRGSGVGFALMSHFRAALCWQRGALAELEADARAALALGSVTTLPLAGVHLAAALVERGQADAAEGQLESALREAGTPAPVMGALALVVGAHVQLAQQRPHDALAQLIECGRLEEARDVVTPSVTSWRAEAAVLIDRLGEPARAGELADEAVRRADAFGSPVARGIALRAAALVARPPDDDGLGASVALLQDSGARLELARSLVELGAARRRTGRRTDARDPLREGLEIAVACGADALAARAHDELVAAGARPRRDPIESRSTLTASELRVARMAADGLTNREIAQALFLTEKTIEVHLTRAYRKLEIQSRSQLARALPDAAVPV